MRLTFVQSYPVHHDGSTVAEWLDRRDRDLLLPALAASLGHQVELLAVGPERRSLDLDGFRLELYPADRLHRKTRHHSSRALLERARERDGDLHVVKGIDGGAGLDLLRLDLGPAGKPWAMVLGGKYWNRWVGRAAAVGYETDEQRRRLMRPGLRFWRRRLPAGRLVRLPKWVDCERFRPRPAGEAPAWDVILVGRLLGWKRMDAVGALGRGLKVAVVGGGPEEARLRAAHPRVDWLGRQPQPRVAELLRRARLFFHPGRHDYYPRVVAEALASGLPVVAIRGGVSADAIPAGAGLLIDEGEAAARIEELLASGDRLEAMARAARDHAVRELGADRSRAALARLLEAAEAAR